MRSDDNALRSSKDFDAIRNDARFIAILQKLTPCSAPEHRQFDFWLGSWEVKSAAGQVLGRNRITRKHGGCVLFEEWESAGGGTGSSFSVGNIVTLSVGSRAAVFAYAGTTPKLTTVTENATPRSVIYDGVGNEQTIGSDAFGYSPRNSLITRTRTMDAA